MIIPVHKPARLDRHRHDASGMGPISYQFWLLIACVYGRHHCFAKEHCDCGNWLFVTLYNCVLGRKFWRFLHFHIVSASKHGGFLCGSARNEMMSCMEGEIYTNEIKFIQSEYNVYVEHCIDVIVSAMASQIISVSIIYSTVCSGVDQRKHQSSASLAFCARNSPVTGEFPAQRASNTENFSIWWRRHETNLLLQTFVNSLAPGVCHSDYKCMKMFSSEFLERFQRHCL